MRKKTAAEEAKERKTLGAVGTRRHQAEEKAEKGKAMSKSKAAKKARKGDDMGAPGKNFSRIADKAAKEYGSKEAGEKVAGAIFQKKRRAGTL